MRALSDVATLTGEAHHRAARDVPQLLGKLGLIEAKLGGKTFAQLGAALALRQFGTDLAQERPLAEPERRGAGRPGGRCWTRGASTIARRRSGDRPARELLRRGGAHRHHGPPDGPDHRPRLRRRPARAGGRASSCAARSTPTTTCPPAATTATRRSTRASSTRRPATSGRKDIQKAVAPSLQAVMRDLVGPGLARRLRLSRGAAPSAPSATWTRWRSSAFLAAAPGVPARAAGRSGQRCTTRPGAGCSATTSRDRHLLDMFGFGRGNYSYMTPARQWQQTTSFLGKAAHSLGLLAAALRAEKVACVRRPAGPADGGALRVVPPGRSAGRRLAGAPGRPALRAAHHHRTQGRASPTTCRRRTALPGSPRRSNRWRPALVPYLELDDGRVLVASDGADEIVPDPAAAACARSGAAGRWWGARPPSRWTPG